MVVRHVLWRLHAPRAGTAGHLRQGFLLPLDARFGSHNLVFGYDRFNDIRQADNHQSGSDYRILSAGAILTGTGAGRDRPLADLPRRRHHHHPVEPDSRGERRLGFPDPLRLRQRHLADQRPADRQCRYPLRQESRRRSVAGTSSPRTARGARGSASYRDPTGRALVDRDGGRREVRGGDFRTRSPMRRRPAATRRPASSSIAAPASTVRARRRWCRRRRRSVRCSTGSSPTAARAVCR